MYLAHLVDLGYHPCETEQLMIDQAAADHGDTDTGDTGNDTDIGADQMYEDDI